MAARQPAFVLPFLRRLAAPAGETDADLLCRFLGQRDEAAFTALVLRHGPMVYGVCQRVLRNAHDAEDAFQATFLVLARGARSLAKRDSLASWLHGVAYRTALKARAGLAKRREKERQVLAVPEEELTPAVVWTDLRPVLDEEVQRLPEKYRVPFILCYLEGKTNEEAARLVNCPKGTVLSRLATARQRLRTRLARRGIALSAGLLAAALSEGAASAVMPPLLIAPTVKAAAGGLVSANVLALAKGTVRAMLLSKLKVVTALLLAVASVGAGGLLLTHRTEGAEKPETPAEVKEPAQKDADAIQGTWKVVNLEQVGHEPTDDERAAFRDGALKFVITADKIVYPDKSEATYKLDPATTPKRFEFTVSTGKKDVLALGIYSLDGDELKLCYGREGDRDPPTSFDVKKARAGTFPSCWTLRREKAAAGGPKQAQDPLVIKNAVLEDVDAEQGIITLVCGIAEDVKEESQRGEIEKEQARLQQAVEAAGKNRKLERLAVRVAKGAGLTFSSRHLPSVGNSVQRSLADLAKRKWLYASVDLVVEDDQLVVKKLVVWW
jgi:RNA polymerase sigma factor (sigma-70 family)